MNYTSKSLECGPLKLWGPHNNALRIKPANAVHRINRLVVTITVAFVLIAPRDQLEQHVGVTVGIG